MLETHHKCTWMSLKVDVLGSYIVDCVYSWCTSTQAFHTPSFLCPLSQASEAGQTAPRQGKTRGGQGHSIWINNSYWCCPYMLSVVTKAHSGCVIACFDSKQEGVPLCWLSGDTNIHILTIQIPGMHLPVLPIKHFHNLMCKSFFPAWDLSNLDLALIKHINDCREIFGERNKTLETPWISNLSLHVAKNPPQNRNFKHLSLESSLKHPPSNIFI